MRMKGGEGGWLPQEVLINILLWLSVEEIVQSVQNVARVLSKVVQNHRLWQEMWTAQLPLKIPESLPLKSVVELVRAACWPPPPVVQAYVTNATEELKLGHKHATLLFDEVQDHRVRWISCCWPPIPGSPSSGVLLGPDSGADIVNGVLLCAMVTRYIQFDHGAVTSDNGTSFSKSLECRLVGPNGRWVDLRFFLAFRAGSFPRFHALLQWQPWMEEGHPMQVLSAPLPHWSCDRRGRIFEVGYGRVEIDIAPVVDGPTLLEISRRIGVEWTADNLASLWDSLVLYASLVDELARHMPYIVSKYHSNLRMAAETAIESAMKSVSKGLRPRVGASGCTS
eukprot:Sspe_Gene.103190::Locus_79007_Transcript_1_2_Confidence_0.500_Length_1127::g.103190::m.103190